MLAALFLLPFFWIAVLFGIFIAIAAWEWAALSGLRSSGARLIFVIALGVVGIGGIYLSLWSRGFASALFVLSAIWWSWALFGLFANGRQPTLYDSPAGKIASGFFVLVPAWVAAVFLYGTDSHRPWALIFLLVVVSLADAAAFFVGRALGKHKLAPTISPGKTIEGLIGALLVVVLLAYFYGTMLLKHEGMALLLWLLFIAIVVLVSVVGDLTESKFKRIAGVKDSGRILPGHGGVLDRIDAATAAAPVYALGWLLLEVPS